MTTANSKPGEGMFQEVDYPEPHRARGLEILKRHPEVRALFGRNPWTGAVILFVVFSQLGLAVLLQNAPWWTLLLAAWGVGAFLTHCTFCLYHEAAHYLIFPSRFANNVFGLIANIPQLLPSYGSFRQYHLKHHQYQGDYERDADLAARWEARLIGNTMLGKALWEVFFPIFQSIRTARFTRNGQIPFLTGWVVANVAIQAAVIALVVTKLAPGALFYLFASFFFSVGFHPLGARWIQEHFVVKEGQETYSYYGPLNRLSMNVGFHNEHHDFPFVPWNNLPKLKALVPEVYDRLYSHTSWFGLWIRFLTDPGLSLYSRVTRDGNLNRVRAALPREAYAAGTFDESPSGAV